MVCDFDQTACRTNDAHPAATSSTGADGQEGFTWSACRACLGQFHWINRIDIFDCIERVHHQHTHTHTH